MQTVCKLIAELSAIIMVFMTNVLRTAILPLTGAWHFHGQKVYSTKSCKDRRIDVHKRQKEIHISLSLSPHTHKLANHHHQLSKVLRTKTSSRQAELQSVMNIVLHLSISDQMEFDCNLLSWRHARIYSFCFNLRCRATEARGPLASVYY